MVATRKKNLTRENSTIANIHTRDEKIGQKLLPNSRKLNSQRKINSKMVIRYWNWNKATSRRNKFFRQRINLFALDCVFFPLQMDPCLLHWSENLHTDWKKRSLWLNRINTEKGEQQRKKNRDKFSVHHVISLGKQLKIENKLLQIYDDRILLLQAKAS